MKSKNPGLMITIGNNLRILRREHGKTQEQFAEELVISTSFYANMERGTKSPSVETLWMISKHLNVSMDSLCNDGMINNNIENIVSILKSQPEAVTSIFEKILHLIIKIGSLNDNGNCID